MAKKIDGFNLSAVIRDFQSKNPSIPATQALEAVRKAHQGRKINEGTFKATFYKLAGGGKKKSVRRRKPRRVAGNGDHPEAVMKAGLSFIRLAGSVANARERLTGLAELIETAKEVR